VKCSVGCALNSKSVWGEEIKRKDTWRTTSNVCDLWWMRRVDWREGGGVGIVAMVTGKMTNNTMTLNFKFNTFFFLSLKEAHNMI